MDLLSLIYSFFMNLKIIFLLTMSVVTHASNRLNDSQVSMTGEREHSVKRNGCSEFFRKLLCPTMEEKIKSLREKINENSPEEDLDKNVTEYIVLLTENKNVNWAQELTKLRNLSKNPLIRLPWEEEVVGASL